MNTTEVRIGVMGTLRGASYVEIFTKLEGARVTAVCENNPKSLEKIQKYIDEEHIQVFTDYDEFIASGLFDGVLLANYFFEHVPFAIKAMEHGVHVLSECTPALTLAECVELCRAVERTGCKYMLAENYPFFACNLEMKRLYDSGKLGRALYCEGEYNHPVSAHDKNMLSPGRLHWRNWLPRTYYITHALAPLMHITGDIPKSVNAKCVFAPDSLRGTACRVGDLAAIMLCEMRDGSLARITGCSAWGGHGNWYRICGEKGNVENVRGSLEQIRVQYNGWQIPEGEEEVNIRDAKWFDDEKLNAIASEATHGGGDFWVAYFFRKYLLGEYEPFFNVYRAVTMSAVAVLALRRSQNGGKEYQIPDFTKEEDRLLCEHDTDSPFPDENGHATMACCSHPDYMPTEEDFAQAEKEWKEAGLID